jgi:hypothetical protein
MFDMYLISKRIPASDLFNGRLDRYGIRELTTTHTTKRHRLLCDESLNLLSVILNDEGNVAFFIKGVDSPNSPWIIFDAIANEFNCVIQADRH